MYNININISVGLYMKQWTELTLFSDYVILFHKVIYF